MKGIVEGIYLADRGGAEMRAVEVVRAPVGKGLEGDRYALENGSFSRWPGLGRAVTLIDVAAIAAVMTEFGLDLSAGRSRRNIVTSGIRLNELIGKRFRIGTARFRGDRLAEPCGYLERRVGEGLQAALKGRGGLRADVVEEGVIQVGDTIEIVDTTAPGTR